MTSEVAAVAAFGLRTGHELPASLSDERFQALLAGCEQHRLLGFLGSAVSVGALALSLDQTEELEQRWRAWLTHDVRVEHMLLQAVGALDRAGIDSRVLKGVALAHTVYDDPASRVFGDVDLLVPGHELSRAAGALEASHLRSGRRSRRKQGPQPARSVGGYVRTAPAATRASTTIRRRRRRTPTPSTPK